MARPKGSKNKEKETLYTMTSDKCKCSFKSSIKSMTGTCGEHGNSLYYHEK